MLGAIIVGFLRGALDITGTGTARGLAFENAQTVLRNLTTDLSQVVAAPAHPDGPRDDLAFVVMRDPFGRQMLAFTRAWGEEQRTLAGYDAGRTAPEQGYGADFTGRNVYASMRASGGNIEVVYLMEPFPDGTRLYRAERSPPRENGLIDRMIRWCIEYEGSLDDQIAPATALMETEIDGEPLWDQFHLVAENVLALGVECWDDWDRTTTWRPGPGGPVGEWSMARRFAEGKYLLPRALRLTLMVAGDGPLARETWLTGNLEDWAETVPVMTTDRFPDTGSGAAFIRVGGEVIAYESRGSRTFSGARRGTMGTTPQLHRANATVHAGEVFERVYQLPVTR